MKIMVKSMYLIHITCFSEYESGDNVGLLSMWRGYGEDGEGAAIVFDTAKLAVI